MWGIERNKDPELPMKQRNTSWFVILDDRKHGRAGKFPVFYDIDTGDYLEPPEGFLDSPYETLREWYAVHPEHDPNNAAYQEPLGNSALPLSEENQDKTGSDLSEEDIPPAEEESVTTPAEQKSAWGDQAQEALPEGKEGFEDKPATLEIPDVPDMPDDDMDDEAPF